MDELRINKLNITPFRCPTRGAMDSRISFGRAMDSFPVTSPMFEFNNVGNKNMEAAVGSWASIMIKNKRGTSFVGFVSNLMFPHWDNRPSPERLAHRSELPGIGSSRHVFSKFCVHGWNEGQRIINLALPQKLVLVTTLGHACQNVFEASPLQEKQPTTRKCLIGQHADDANQ